MIAQVRPGLGTPHSQIYAFFSALPCSSSPNTQAGKQSLWALEPLGSPRAFIYFQVGLELWRDLSGAVLIPPTRGIISPTFLSSSLLVLEWGKVWWGRVASSTTCRSYHTPYSVCAAVNTGQTPNNYLLTE